MRPCVFIIPYFGKFKNYFPLFLLTCKANPSFNWMIFTDCEEKYDYPENVSVFRMDFNSFRELVNQAFTFEVNLDRPYKLCDYKPAYGYILREYIQDYQYWGYCDCDLLLGNLEEILLPILKKGYDKIFAAGHMTLYKNTELNNQRFMGTDLENGTLYRRAFSSNKIYALDEMCYLVNVHTLFEQADTNIFADDLSFNVSTTQYRFVRKYYDNSTHRWYEAQSRSNLLIWDGKDIIEYYFDKDRKLRAKKYLYLHLQSRQLRCNQDEFKKPCIIVITPIGFSALEELPKDTKIIRRMMKLPLNKKNMKMALKRAYHLLKPRKKTWEFNPYKEYNEDV